MKPELINLHFIPEEYRQQISDLIKSNDEANWDLSYQLIIGLTNNRLTEFETECYFRALLNHHLHNNIPYKLEGDNIDYYRLNRYLYSTKSYKQ